MPDSEGWVRIDLVPLVQAWICGELPDYGLMLVPTAANPESRYTSREWRNRGQRPRLRLQTSGLNPCADTADHFVITHDTFGIYCLAESITVRVEDDLNNPMTSYAETVTLDTQSGRGTWTLVTGSGSSMRHVTVRGSRGGSGYGWLSIARARANSSPWRILNEAGFSGLGT